MSSPRPNITPSSTAAAAKLIAQNPSATKQPVRQEIPSPELVSKIQAQLKLALDRKDHNQFIKQFYVVPDSDGGLSFNVIMREAKGGEFINEHLIQKEPIKKLFILLGVPCTNQGDIRKDDYTREESASVTTTVTTEGVSRNIPTGEERYSIFIDSATLAKIQPRFALAAQLDKRAILLLMAMELDSRRNTSSIRSQIGDISNNTSQSEIDRKYDLINDLLRRQYPFPPSNSSTSLDHYLYACLNNMSDLSYDEYYYNSHQVEERSVCRLM